MVIIYATFQKWNFLYVDLFTKSKTIATNGLRYNPPEMQELIRNFFIRIDEGMFMITVVGDQNGNEAKKLSQLVGIKKPTPTGYPSPPAAHKKCIYTP